MAASPEQRHAWALGHYLAARDIWHGGRHYSWAVTALFYSAMHLVLAGLPTVPGLTIAQQNPESHEGRAHGAEGTNWVVRRYVSTISTPYLSLYDASYEARYKGGAPSREEVRLHRAHDLAAIAEWSCEHVHRANCACCWLRDIRSRWPISDPTI